MDVKHARITCEQLDLKMGLERNEFWISKPVEEGKEEAEAERRVGGWGTAVIGDVDLEGEQAENTQYAKEVIEINNNDDDDLEESVRAWDKSLDTTSPHSNDNLTTEFEDLEVSPHTTTPISPSIIGNTHFEKSPPAPPPQNKSHPTNSKK